MDWEIDNNILNNSAVQKPDTVKPSTNQPANWIIIALITSKNSPNVKIVAGKVRITNIGWTVSLKKAKTMATNIAMVKLATSTPGK